MDFQGRSVHLTAVAMLLLPLSLAAQAHLANRMQSNSAARVAAELTTGKINSAESRPGDAVTVTLKNDLRSNGEIVLKKGATITGVVRSVKRAEAKGVARIETNAQTQSMVEVEWLAPATAKAQNLSITLETVTQVHPTLQAEGNVTGCAIRVTGDCESSDASHWGNTLVVANPALLRMPSVVAVDHQTSSAIEGDLDSAAPGPLFKIGHGELIANNASQQSVDIFSHLRNDTVITSSSRTFEISSGAQMQLLVGMNRR